MEEITAEYATEALVASSELRAIPWVTVACKTDLGRVRENNEDKFEYFVTEDRAVLASRGLIFVVCDGMGGHAAGQIASELAAKTFIDVYLHHPSTEPETAMRAAVAAANRFVNDVGRAVPSRKGMGTTLSVLVLLQDQAYLVQVGDSRIYRLRGGELRQMTFDHTWVEEATRKGMITAEEAENHPYRHVLTRAIGTEEGVEPDVFVEPAQAGDVYLLCSDGLINHVADAQIGETLGHESPSDAAWKLVGQALQGGGSDNCTVIVVRLDQIEAV
ncbi:MAG: Stp1/IreP family PP2C-type Ser/Thr phosphatase [Fimbriimonas ginsengisoli]|uniref:Stp1/IreP family PP2C-type Ser/Thr phosphatase n=1 Tax=Fimbriimonas ginsengisoli TaxID=1005039 RepID=A0A931PT99_FIMGI|nr:Stp1/IreP family PP2C-type Ser/Thr phosphatase [Fimbriimonas ginsengisoli]